MEIDVKGCILLVIVLNLQMINFMKRDDFGDLLEHVYNYKGASLVLMLVDYLIV